MTSFHCADVIDVIGAGTDTPAFATAMSTRPNSADRAGNERVHCVAISSVCLDGNAPTTGGFHQTNGFLQILLVCEGVGDDITVLAPVADHDVRATLRECDSVGAPLTACGAGDQCNFSFEAAFEAVHAVS